MAYLVSILGLISTGIGLMGLAQPRLIVALVNICDGPFRFRLAIALRLAMGLALLVVAPACRLPITVTVIGVIAIVAAAAIAIGGQRRLDSLIEWWFAQPPSVMRASALFTLVFGALLIYSGA